MNWLNFLHFYQPATQQADILDAIVAQSYRPIFEKINELPSVKVTVNITGSLLEALDNNNHKELLGIMKNCVSSGKVELTGSAKYHAFLPLIPESEIRRQIIQNEESLRYYLGKDIKLRGFFPPEMGYDPKILPIIRELNYDWIVIDEISYASGDRYPDYNSLYRIKDSDIFVFFRNRRASNLIMSAIVRSKESLLDAFKYDMEHKKYLVTGMDGETFGHHRPGLEGLLFDIFSDNQFHISSFSEYLDRSKNDLPIEDINPVQSTWASSVKDINEGVQFLSWLDKTNVIHSWQWELQHMALTAVESTSHSHPDYDKMRRALDLAMGSDHFWWASAKPWWSLEMIEDGAFRLLTIIHNSPGVEDSVKHKASDLYQKIISTAFDWQRTGKIREMARSQSQDTKIPFKDRTLGKGGSEQGIYYAFIDMIKNLEKKAASEGEYEKAILWRDALFKLDKKLDIYETIHAIDLLRQEIPHEEVEKTLDKYTEPYKKIRGGQPEQRG